MMDLLIYLLKVVACSGILYLFYFFALRNKLFHQWNRFYLLIAVMLALTAPLVQVTIYNYLDEKPNQAIQILQVVYDAGIYMEEVTITSQKSDSRELWIMGFYSFISVIIFLVTIYSFIRIVSIIRSHLVSRLGKVRFVSTLVPGTPFSFFNFIFWNAEIDIQSETGQKIFQHELVHIKEKHSLDKLFMQLILVVFWCNPFFWLIRKELNHIHEFIADRKSVSAYGPEAFAAMILQCSYPGHFNSLTNSFFQSSIKRRIAMLTKNQHPGWNYFSRIAAFVVILTTIAAFSLRPESISNFYSEEKEYVVVIDAGHGVKSGGTRSGAYADNYYEDDIVLSIAKKIKELNTNKNIRIELSRAGAEDVELNRRVEMTKELKADLFISLHLNATQDGEINEGAEVILPNKNPDVLKKSKLLGSALVTELENIISTKKQLVTRTTGIYVLNFSSCPAVLIQCGNISSAKDRIFITDEDNQRRLAKEILDGIENYLSQVRVSSNNEIKGNITRSPQKIELTASEFNLRKGSIQKDEELPLVYLNGEKYKVSNIESIRFQGQKATYYEKNNPEAIRLFGEEAKNGVILFDGAVSVIDTVPANPVVKKVEVEASVSKVEWMNFLSENMQEVIKSAIRNGAPSQSYTVYVKFIVDVNGSVSNITIVNDPGYGIGQKLVQMMSKSPKWNPALIKKKKVRSYHVQPITIKISEDNESTTMSASPYLKHEDAARMNRLQVSEVEITDFLISAPGKNTVITHRNQSSIFDVRTKQILAEIQPGDIVTFSEINAIKNGKKVKYPGKLYEIVQ